VTGSGLYWLSFVDRDMREGDRFLGVAIVEATDPVSAAAKCWDLEINPGGEVQIIGPIPTDIYPAAVRDRLLDRTEAEAL
jgi:hypothetical protein